MKALNNKDTIVIGYVLLCIATILLVFGIYFTDLIAIFGSLLSLTCSVYGLKNAYKARRILRSEINKWLEQDEKKELVKKRG